MFSNTFLLVMFTNDIRLFVISFWLVQNTFLKEFIN